MTRNDAETMARIPHPDMELILGDGRVNARHEQLEEARNKIIAYEIQDEDPGTQTVRPRPQWRRLETDR